MPFRKALLVLASAAAMTTAASAETQSQRVQYTVSLLGLPIARAVLQSNIDDTGFAIAGTFSSAGLARIFDKTNGTVSVTGNFQGPGSRPKDYTLNYVSGKKSN